MLCSAYKFYVLIFVLENDQHVLFLTPFFQSYDTQLLRNNINIYMLRFIELKLTSVF